MRTPWVDDVRLTHVSEHRRPKHTRFIDVAAIGSGAPFRVRR